MTVEKVKAFWEAVKRDPGLQEKIKASTDGENDVPPEVVTVLAIAKEAGYDFTAADLWRNKLIYCMELSDEDLEKVARVYGWRRWICELPKPDFL